jgi:hypothetical protein
MERIPDHWVILKSIIPATGENINKVFAGWDVPDEPLATNWAVNSGNIAEQEFEERWEFTGSDEVTFICYKRKYGLTYTMSKELNTWISNLNEGETLEDNVTYYCAN